MKTMRTSKVARATTERMGAGSDARLVTGPRHSALPAYCSSVTGPPDDVLAVLELLDRVMSDRSGFGGPVPVLHARRSPDHVSRLHDDTFATFLLHPTSRSISSMLRQEEMVGNAGSIIPEPCMPI